MKKLDYNPNLIEKIQPVGGISFKDNYIRKGDGYESCIHIYDYPTDVTEFWLKDLIEEFQDTVITVDIETGDKNTILKKIDRAITEHDSRVNESTDHVSSIKSSSEVQDLVNLVYDLTKNDEIMKYIVIRIYLYERTLEGLHKKEKDVMDKLESLRFRGAVFLNEAEYEWKSLFLSLSDQEKLANKVVKQPIPTLSLSAGYPFHFVELKDKAGTVIGESKTGGSIIFNPFTRDEIRKSYNSIMVGLTGAGKSTLMKKLMSNNSILGDTIRILDLTGEFGGIVSRLGGKVIRLDGTNGMINPFQIFATMIDDDNNVLEEQSYMFHLNKLSMQYNYLSKDCNSDELLEFENCVNEFYRENGIDKSNCTTFKVEEYPIMEDFLKFLKGLLYNDVEGTKLRDNITEYRKARLEKIILTISNVINSYGNLFNGHSSIEDISSIQVLSFEVRNLSQFASNVFNAQIFSILTMLWNEALKQGIKQKKLYDSGQISIEEAIKYILYVDEAHKYVNSNNELAVDFFINFIREDRKYFAGLILATQSINDMVPKNKENHVLEKIRTLFELTQYKFIMQQDNNTKEALEDIFNGQLNSSEIDIIPYFQKGDVILLINGMENILFNVKLSKEEEKLFEGGA
ncbi:ATP-binding protein [Clostridium sardiniense]|uniref:ATP-binding protein n=1 Tax=Clostridium sardiniense TaxID=29369 RepID=A0ABS7KZQ6_CLOSR|nr:ATP-binding protein [Clostridium sardiniense]MBY0756294.1 ATP-binding protein [Clostridium sardiniense]MDQ0461448.1 hypothetical protein [Clostridium sardiniense]